MFAVVSGNFITDVFLFVKYWEPICWPNYVCHHHKVMQGPINLSINGLLCSTVPINIEIMVVARTLVKSRCRRSLWWLNLTSHGLNPIPSRKPDVNLDLTKMIFPTSDWTDHWKTWNSSFVSFVSFFSVFQIFQCSI